MLQAPARRYVLLGNKTPRHAEEPTQSASRSIGSAAVRESGLHNREIFRLLADLGNSRGAFGVGGEVFEQGFEQRGGDLA